MSTNPRIPIGDLNCIGIPIGDLNCIELILGNRGQGKSTYAVDKAMALAYSTGGYIVAHSLGARFPSVLPDGTPVPVDYYPSVDSLDKGLKRKPGRIAVLVGGNGDELLRYARKLSTSLRKKAYYQEYGYLYALFKPWSPLRNMDGIVCRPIIVIVDEGVAMSMNLGKTSKKDIESKEFREAIYSARHEHIAYLFQIQDPNAIGATLQTQATRYVVFRLDHQWALNATYAMGASKEQIEDIRNAPRFEFVEFGPDVPRERPIDELKTDDKSIANKESQPPVTPSEKK